MIRTVGIICEYNPFHNGHKYQIDTIKSQFENANIIAIMSGNFVQRGDASILDKYSRARAALECGVDAVVELPYPYSSSAAEIFACAGVEIAGALGCDALCFGTESDDLDSLARIAEAIDSKEFAELINSSLRDKSINYIKHRENALKAMGLEVSDKPNDMLAIEYLRAIRKLRPNILPFAIKRMKASYKDLSEGEMMSASGIRHSFYESEDFLAVPTVARNIYIDCIKNGMILNNHAFYEKLHFFALMKSAQEINDAYDSQPGMGEFIKERAMMATSGENFDELLSSKSVTSARYKRVILYSLIGINKVGKKPEFTILLGANKKGIEALKGAKEGFSIITKHSDCKKLSKEALDIYEKTRIADSFYCTLLKKSISPQSAYKFKPIIF